MFEWLSDLDQGERTPVVTIVDSSHTVAVT